jgi:hypothetical protein
MKHFLTLLFVSFLCTSVSGQFYESRGVGFSQALPTFIPYKDYGLVWVFDLGGMYYYNADDEAWQPANSFQTITKAGSTVTLSDAGGSFTDENDIYDDTDVVADIATNSTGISDNVTAIAALPTDTDVSNAQTEAQNYADVNDDSGTDDQTLQEVTDEGATTTADITANSFTGDGSALTDVDAEKLGNEDPSFYEDQNMTYDNSTGVLSLEGSDGVELDDEFYPRGKAAWLFNSRSKNNIVIPELQNILYSARDWAQVGVTSFNSGHPNNIFSGSFDTYCGWNQGQAVEISIDLDAKGRMDHLIHGYGVVYVTMFLDSDVAGDITLTVTAEDNDDVTNETQTVTGVKIDQGETTDNQIVYKFDLTGDGTVFMETLTFNFTARGNGSLTGITDITLIPTTDNRGPQYREGKQSRSWDKFTFYDNNNVAQVTIDPDDIRRKIDTESIQTTRIWDSNTEKGENNQILSNTSALRVDWIDPDQLVVTDPTDGSASQLEDALENINTAAEEYADDNDADAQTLDVATLVGTKLNLSLENDGQFTKEINLNPIITRGISGSSGSAGAGAGVYTITHNLGAAATAISCNARGGTFYHIQVTTSGTNSFTVKIFNADGSQETTATNIILDSILTFQ